MPKQPNGTPGKKPLARSVKVRIGRSLDRLMMLRGRSKLLKGPAIFADLDLASSRQRAVCPCDGCGTGLGARGFEFL
jgi:hypothetical protein